MLSPLSLKQLCMAFIRVNPVRYKDIPLDLCRQLRDNDVQVNSTPGLVKQVIQENEALFDEWLGWSEGLHSVNEHKHYHFINAIIMEKYAKKGVYNCGHIPPLLTLFYIQSDVNFKEWFLPSAGCLTSPDLAWRVRDKQAFIQSLL
jgi:hypothetical protein